MASAADSATSIALSDAVRTRVTQLVKSKVSVIPKPKLCEALGQSGFACDVLMDDQQARKLARFLQVHAYVTGSFAKNGTNLTADVQMIDIASSGIAGRFTASNGNPGTAAALAETIAQRIATTVRLSEGIRNCNEERKKGQFGRARAEVQKALAIDPNSTGAYLCIATIFEATRQPVDSVIAAAKLALKGDSCNGTAWEKIASGYQQKNDSVQAAEAYISQLCGEPRNTQKRLQIAQLLRQMKKGDRAIDVLNAGLKLTPGDAQMLDMKLTVCNEVSNFRCALDVWVAKFDHDTAVRDAAAANPLKADTAALNRLRAGSAAKVDSARPYLRPGLNSPDSTQRLAGSVIMLTGGSKIAQAGAYDGAYRWLDTLLTIIAPRNAADTLGPKQQVRINASFWYGLSSVLTLNGPYQAMTKAKGAARCPDARAVFDRLARTKAALSLGRRVHPPTADQMLNFVAQYEKAKPSVQGAFKCKPPLN